MNWYSVDQQLRDAHSEISAAEMHGHLSGRLVGGHVLAGASGERIVADLLNISGEGAQDTLKSCVELMQETESRIESSSFGFDMLLPDDDLELSNRLQGLSEWCNSFLEGLGHTLAASEMNANAEMREILADLSEIGNLSVEAEETNENEAYYTELYEYVRVAVMNLYSLFRTQAQDEAKADKEH